MYNLYKIYNKQGLSQFRLCTADYALVTSKSTVWTSHMSVIRHLSVAMRRPVDFISMVTQKYRSGHNNGKKLRFQVHPLGLRPENGCAGDARKKLKTTTRHLVREGAPRQQTRNCLENNQREKLKKLVAGLRWKPDTRTDWPTDCRP
jgi:hypothetical protein